MNRSLILAWCRARGFLEVLNKVWKQRQCFQLRGVQIARALTQLVTVMLAEASSFLQKNRENSKNTLKTTSHNLFLITLIPEKIKLCPKSFVTSKINNYKVLSSICYFRTILTKSLALLASISGLSLNRSILPLNNSVLDQLLHWLVDKKAKKWINYTQSQTHQTRTTE